MLRRELISAYKATNYRVLSEPEFSLTVDKYSLELDELFERLSANSATFITAWNPFSEDKTQQENTFQNDCLKADLEVLNATILPAFGAWSDDPSKGEDSFLALGITEKNAVELGEKFKQNAILFAAQDAVPRLILLEE